MKVLLVNGSPHEKGCTNRALEEVASSLNKENIETKIFWIGNESISGCLGCQACSTLGHCFIDDVVNKFSVIAKDYDGFVFGSPVHYASLSGQLTSFMDRLFYSNHDKSSFRLKPVASVLSARRSGTTASFDQLNKYFLISEMIVIGSQYWNNVHGFTPLDVEKDLEGLQTMRVLGSNMAYVLKCQAIAREKGISLPKKEAKKEFTSFFRD
jgi:multimeric flavodoxin WrbA